MVMETNPRNQNAKETKMNASIMNGTKVLNTNDAEQGTIHSAVAYAPATGEWTEYEVVTTYGIERWQRSDFVLMSEIETQD